ncbi:MAG: protein translocase subunit SecD [Armatimonadota bacterium]|nr:protein translocase subunit SecD [Armatimonadota bacterium]MDR7487047.1 protein translocase subunit SecD [Armatimonadota bacterium]MDR7532386.1 protein translocase subunit SecD [Armatimonadota bacterium]MDR7535313.1 protein translocase subunit SecD [Armatimonadota bacterium]
MGSRLGLRLVLILLVAVVALQVAFQPVRVRGWRPQWQGVALRMNLGLDLRGGSLLVLEGRDSPTTKATPDAVDAAMRVIERRIDQLGVVEPTIQRQGTSRIIVELPGIDEPERAIRLIGKTALLEFVDTGAQRLPEGARWSADGKTVTLPPPAPGQPAPAPLALPKTVILTGGDLRDARAAFDQTTAEPIVQFEFHSRGGRVFEEFTGKNIGRYLTIVLDNEVISSPVIRDRITGGRGVISGGFQSIEEARDLAVLLRGGALPIPVEVVENRTVGPQLGRDSIDASVKAGWVAGAAVVGFMVLYYGLPGLLAALALGVYLLVVLALLVGLHATLTLPGIAGLILSVGMAVDANVIIFERTKEELRAGKTLRAAITAGWSRAMSAILDSNVTTLLAGVVLFLLGSGPIRGFAVTLSLGVLASMFSAIVVTRVFVDGAVAAGLGAALVRVAGPVAR